jgi:NTE family protein
MVKQKPKIALVLGGGGARGMAHIGALKALVEADIQFDLVVGTSMGALLGACFALGQSVADLETEALTLTKRKAIAELLDICVPKQSLIAGHKAHRYINKLIANADFVDVKLPMLVVATNLADGQPVVLQTGDLADAIQASISVPGIFPPIKIGDKYLVDGGVACPTPIQVAFDFGADIVIAVDLMLQHGGKIQEKPGLIFTLMQSYEIIRSMSVWDDANAKHKVFVIRPDLNGNGVVSSFKFFNIQAFIDEGYRATQAVLPQIKQAIDNFQ